MLSPLELVLIYPLAEDIVVSLIYSRCCLIFVIM